MGACSEKRSGVGEDSIREIRKTAENYNFQQSFSCIQMNKTNRGGAPADRRMSLRISPRGVPRRRPRRAKKSLKIS